MGTMNTLDFYNQKSEEYFNSTATADVSALYAHFVPLLPPHANIFDIGCGSGRDSKHFLEKGHFVTAIDGSKELCKLAKSRLGIPVQHMLFSEIEYDAKFDAAWACSSLLHVPKDELPDIIKRICTALKPGGVFYASFKYGNTERLTADRFFSDYNENDIPEMTASAPELKLIEYWISEDVRSDRSGEKWLNIIWRKSNIL